MQVFEIINTDVEPLRVADTSAEAIQAMDANSIDKLPIVDHTTRKLVGMVSRQAVSENMHELPGSLIDSDEKVICIDPDAHLFDAARNMFDIDARILPVVDQDKNFLGVLTRKELLIALSNMLNVNEPGVVLTVELDKRDLMLSEIVRITENEDAKILGLTVEAPDANNANFRVSIKMNLLDVSRVTAALNRYGYLITQETENAHDIEELNNRADEFLKYLDI